MLLLEEFVDGEFQVGEHGRGGGEERLERGERVGREHFQPAVMTLYFECVVELQRLSVEMCRSGIGAFDCERGCAERVDEHVSLDITDEHVESHKCGRQRVACMNYGHVEQ